MVLINKIFFEIFHLADHQKRTVLCFHSIKHHIDELYVIKPLRVIDTNRDPLLF